MKLKFVFSFLMIFTAAWTFAETKFDVTGTVEWDTMEINAAVSFELASAGIKLPAGRTQGETILSAGYLELIQPGIMDLQVDSSSTIADLVRNGELALHEVEAIAHGASSVPPALSHDMRKMHTSYKLTISGISSALMRHTRVTPILRTLNPVSTAQYTGIIIIASESLPVHGMRGTAMPVPCLFPKIWDSDMNLIYERSMLESRNNPMVHYSTLSNIFHNNPSGISPELQKVVGDRPLRIFARGVFGINPTDFIIDRSDALLIISSSENRRLLTEGKVAVILDESALKREFFPVDME